VIRRGDAFVRNDQPVGPLYLVEAIPTRQDGNRFRLDLNWTF
jgi:hypothetical protein